MPNPVVYFEILGRDPRRLVAFYRDVFGWEITVLPGGYALVETDAHDHADDGTLTYTGRDAFMNDGVELGSDEETGVPTWRFASEPADTARWFTRGIGGGIGEEAPRVSVAVQVPDLEAALARVVDCGGRRVTEPSEVAEGVWTAEFADPEGNVLVLIRG